MEHAELILKLLKGIGDSSHNLKEGIKGETYEYTEMYPDFARIAREEGQGEAADFFEKVMKVEKAHAERFGRLLGYLESGTLYKRAEIKKWKCRYAVTSTREKRHPKNVPFADIHKASMNY